MTFFTDCCVCAYIYIFYLWWLFRKYWTWIRKCRSAWTSRVFISTICICIPDIGMMVRVFANGSGDLGSILVRVIPKTQKMVLDAPCLTLSIIRYRSRVKWSNPGLGLVPSPTPWCSSYQKGSFQITLDYSCQLYLLTIYMYVLMRQKILFHL